MNPRLTRYNLCANIHRQTENMRTKNVRLPTLHPLPGSLALILDRLQLVFLKGQNKMWHSTVWCQTIPGLTRNRVQRSLLNPSQGDGVHQVCERSGHEKLIARSAFLTRPCERKTHKARASPQKLAPNITSEFHFHCSLCPINYDYNCVISNYCGFVIGFRILHWLTSFSKIWYIRLLILSVCI